MPEDARPVGTPVLEQPKQPNTLVQQTGTYPSFLKFNLSMCIQSQKVVQYIEMGTITDQIFRSDKKISLFMYLFVRAEKNV